MPSSVSVTDTRSPLFRPSLRRISAGKVTWPFSRMRISFLSGIATAVSKVLLSHSVEVVRRTRAIGGVSSPIIPQSLPDMPFSPNGSALVTVTNACGGCQLWHAKYTTIRVFNMATGAIGARFHPRRGPLSILTVSDDGLRIGALQTDNTPHAVWLTLDGHTGRVLRLITLPDVCCWEPLLDPTGTRLYVACNNRDRQLTLAAFDLASGTQLVALTIPAVWAGHWNTAGIVQNWLPGIALSADGRRLAVPMAIPTRLP